MRRALLLLLILIESSQKIQIYPDDSYEQNTASSRACFASCQFCQIKTGFCQQCVFPYFQKDVNGNCALIDGYIIQSSLQELISGQGFTPFNISWSNTKTTSCSPSPEYFQSDLKVLGPFNSKDGNINYRRSVSVHKYVKMRFFLLKIDWGERDSLSIIMRDQNNTVLSNQTILYSQKVPRQSLCSDTNLDQRFAISYQFQNVVSTNIFISFVPNFRSQGASWALSTFLLLTGKCHESCDDCYLNVQPTGCKTCKNFLIQGFDGTCNQCADGFRKMTVEGVQKCEKCPIQYKTCQVNNQVCFYNNLAIQLNPNCTWNSKQNYVSEYYLNTDEFSGSLFSVNGASSTYKCGSYSIVGLANRGGSITRVFTNLRAHQSLSIAFNILIVDQAIAQKNIFQLYIDNVRVQTLFINTVGISSICAGENKQVFQTYPATKFFNNTNTQNLNITIRSSNTENWGIRNFRLSLQVCDQTCLDCGANGCQTCGSFFKLVGSSCSECPQGYSPLGSQSKKCSECPQFCLTCTIISNQNGTQRTCTKCQQGYFIFQGKCQGLPSLGRTIRQDNIQWESTNPIILTSQCTIDYKYQIIKNNKKINFMVVQNQITNSFQIPQTHYKILVSFYLLKIDNWLPSDELNLYLNDLLVLKKTYGQFGNKICFQQPQNDLASYEQIQIRDNNQTLHVHFQLSSLVNGTRRKFGISNFQVYALACPQCPTYDFAFQIKYSYDQALIIEMLFNRIYVNNDPQLFKKIFYVYINNKTIDYEIGRNDSIRYFLVTHPDSEIILTNVTVYCKYREKVVTDILDPKNQKPFFKGRVLEQTVTQRPRYISNLDASVLVQRYTPMNQPRSVNGIRIFFEVVTRMVIYLGFFSFFIGCLTPCTHFMHNIQKIWLHIYVASLTIPNVLKFSLKGFRQSQGQNIAINPSQWELGLPEYLYYETPFRYQSYYQDITFFRNIYNVGFAAAIYLCFSLVMYILFRSNKMGRQSNNKLLRHMKVTFYRRPFFVFNSVIFYQYITVCIACTLQFIDLFTRTVQETFRGINAAAAIICFVLATAYPLVSFFYLSYKEKDMYSIDYEISYRNRYHEIFYRFLPKNIWKTPNYEFVPISFKQRFYNLLRFGEIWWFCLIFALMYDSPFGQAFLLIISNFLHFSFLWFSSTSYTSTFKILKVLQLIFFVGLQIMILISYQQNQTLTKNAYQAMGVVGVVFIFVILVLSFIRFIYTLVKLTKQYKYETLKGQKLDQRLRNDDFYASFENNNQRIISED